MTPEGQTAQGEQRSGEATLGHGEASGRHDPRGLRLVVFGAVVAALAPLAGFLGGSVVGRSPDARFDPMFSWMVGGLAVGAVGAFVAFVGALRWLSSNRGRW